MVVYEVPLRKVSVKRITRTWHLTSIGYFHDACRLAIRDLAVPMEIRIICLTGRAEGNLRSYAYSKENYSPRDNDCALEEGHYGSMLHTAFVASKG